MGTKTGISILVIAKLSSFKVSSKLRLFINNPNINKIYVLRDEPCPIEGDPEGKVCFIPFKSDRGPTRHIKKYHIALKFIKNNHVDIIISYLLTPHGYLAWYLSKRTKIKWIHCIIAGHYEIWKHGRIAKCFNKHILKSAEQIIVMGEKARDYLERMGFNNQRVTVIPNAVDSDLFSPVIGAPKITDVLYTGRIDENKNLPLLVNAVSLLVKQFPSIRVVIAGDGEKLSEIKQLVNSLRIDSHFVFRGFVQHNDLPELYRSSKVFVFTSRSEGLPMSLVEAMFCGMAPVSTNVGEIEDLIKDGENGFLLKDCDDAKQLAYYVSMLLGDEQLYNLISQKASQVKERYSYRSAGELWGKTIENVFRNKVNSNGKD